jgi:hypothetical protein
MSARSWDCGRDKINRVRAVGNWVSQAGNGYLRKLLVECSNHIWGHFGKQSPLREGA